MSTPPQDRRRFLATALAVPTALLTTLPSAARARGVRLAATPPCGEHGPTPRQTAGPYWKPSSPPRASLLEPGLTGTRLVVQGRVLAPDCTPVPRAVLDFWQADAGGAYDNGGFRLRGHQRSDDAGGFRLETVVPGVYPGRTRHLHVIVKAPGRPPLTTQLYFPGEPENARDGIFDRDLVMKVRDAGDGKLADFVFVLDTTRS